MIRLSVIIPTLNEAVLIGEAIARVRSAGECEIVVVDGGSEDDTLEAAAAADRCLSAPRGRAAQMNAGAGACSGDVLLFLHADCWPEPGVVAAIERSLADASVIGGAFSQLIEAGGVQYRLLEQGNALRVRTLRWIYGDQGLFVRRESFERVGGFPPVALMEDLYLSKRLKREGRLVLLSHRLYVSPRRWEQMGVVRQTLRNWAFVGLAHCGVSPALLAQRYADIR
jgi:rSAM/selenodomain-associated transferase 2